MGRGFTITKYFREKISFYIFNLQIIKNKNSSNLNEILFKMCSINYNNEPAIYKRGTFMHKVNHNGTCNPEIIEIYDDLKTFGEKFFKNIWNKNLSQKTSFFESGTNLMKRKSIFLLINPIMLFLKYQIRKVFLQAVICVVRGTKTWSSNLIKKLIRFMYLF